jgi:hypothetical protein
MEMFEAFLRLLSSYPAWAKACALAGVAFSILVLVFAPRIDASAQAAGHAIVSPPPAHAQAIFLRITGVRLYPSDPDADVRVLAIVNGTTYEHPSVGGVKWMKTGPDMGPKLIELPRAPVYEIRFEMRIRGMENLSSAQHKILDPDVAAGRAGSQLVDSISKLPFSDEYKLYDIKNNTRAASVRATISYSITEGR